MTFFRWPVSESRQDEVIKYPNIRVRRNAGHAWVDDQQMLIDKMQVLDVEQ